MAQTTIMVLKVDLGCERCNKKIKKLLCKIPEIRDQSFFEKEDTVMIKVVSCCPENIRSKLICKGGKIIKSIEIKVPEKPKPEEPKKAVKPKSNKDRPKEDEKPKREHEKPKPPPEKPKEAEKPKPPPEKPKPPEQPEPPLVPPVVTGFPPIYPIGFWGKPCYVGHCGGPCHHGCGIPRQPQSYEGYVRLVPSYDGWASGCGCGCGRSSGCRCEENPTCTIM